MSAVQTDLPHDPCPCHNVQRIANDILEINPKWAILEADATVTRPGDVFVHRNIANQFHPRDDNVLSVLEYSIQHLYIRNIAIVGHKNCGGVAAAYKQAYPQAQVDANATDGLVLHLPEGLRNSRDPQNAINRWLEPLVERIRGLLPPVSLEVVTRDNVIFQVENLLTLRDTILGWSAGQPVLVHGWLIDFTTGIIEHLVTEEIKT
ncbi:hypothetical protein ID866_6226 [Astraeus odoratus]|nr:hypothetical protein ID866_6226 [Astraeus odoratus]